MPRILNHPDEVSGTTILDDGTKIYWTEGRSSSCVVAHPNGVVEKIPVWANHPILDAEEAAENNPDTIIEPMTTADENEWTISRAKQ